MESYTLRHLRQPIFDLPDQEQIHIIQSIRNDRLFAKPTTKKSKAKRKSSVDKKIDGMATMELEQLEKMLEEKLSGK